MKKILFKNFSRNFLIMLGFALFSKNDYISQIIMIFALVYSISFCYYKYINNREKSDNY